MTGRDAAEMKVGFLFVSWRRNPEDMEGELDWETHFNLKHLVFVVPSEVRTRRSREQTFCPGNCGSQPAASTDIFPSFRAEAMSDFWRQKTPLPVCLTKPHS